LQDHPAWWQAETDLLLCQRYSEVLRPALWLLQQREAEDAGRLEAPRRAVAEGVADLDNGRFDMLEGATGLSR
jgi:antitoxin ParD1/3/4